MMLSFMGEKFCCLQTLRVYFCDVFEQLFEILKGKALKLLQLSAPPVAAC